MCDVTILGSEYKKWFCWSFPLAVVHQTQFNSVSGPYARYNSLLRTLEVNFVRKASSSSVSGRRCRSRANKTLVSVRMWLCVLRNMLSGANRDKERMRHATALAKSKFSACWTLGGVGRIGTLRPVARARLIQSRTRGIRKGPKMMRMEWTFWGRNVRRGMTT